MFLRAGCFAILACVSLATFAESPSDTVTIPSKDIWGWAMPGTKNIQDIEPEVFGPEIQTLPEKEQEKRRHDSRVLTIYHHCSTPDGKGFAVVGEGKTALNNVYAVIAEGQNPLQSFPSNEELSLFFYSTVFGAYVRVDHVERDKSSIKIFYRYVLHNDRELTWHFALIPVGKLPPGSYDVTMVQLPVDLTLMHGTYGEIDQKVGDKPICKPFSFSVTR
jgi:hypothetical protein